MQHQETATLQNNPIEPGETGYAPSERHPRLPLGVGSIIGGSFSILFKHIIAVLLIGLIPVLFGQVAPALVLGMATNFDFSAPLSIGASMFAGAAVLAIVQLAAYSVTTALIVQLAYDAKLRRRVHIGRYLRPALTALPPILILSFAVGALIVGLFFLLGLFGAVSRILALAATPVQIVLSLWILAVFPSWLLPSLSSAPDTAPWHEARHLPGTTAGRSWEHFS
ncbi:hypothetical protein ACFQEX_01035 [Roseibium salinum]|uniref:hypothetical protein n=1 Tax=Roseibium salinum TaxID=1604349 RepID=UPI00360DD1A6